MMDYAELLHNIDTLRKQIYQVMLRNDVKMARELTAMLQTETRLLSHVLSETDTDNQTN